MPTYTAIITAYNAENFIHHAIQSVLAQTLQPLEILVVDDGSSDNTDEAVRKFPVQYVYRPNGGPAAARNTGARLAKGEWLAYLDHDDTWYPEKSAMQLQQASPDIGAIFCEKAKNSENVGFSQMFERNYGGNPSGMMIRRTVLESLNGFDEDPELIGVDDYNLWLRFLWAGHRYRTTPQYYFFTPDEDHLGGKPDRMLNSELTNIDKISRLAALDPELVKFRKQAIRRNYLPNLIGARKQKQARSILLKSGLDVPGLIKYTAASFCPAWVLDIRRKLISTAGPK